MRKQRKTASPQPRIEVACLSVTTWKDTVACGHHYYGRMEGSLTKARKSGYGGKTYFAHDVEYTLTAAQAKRLNKCERYSLCPVKYKAGETSIRFYEEQHLHAAAIEHAKALGYDALILGDRGTCQPQKVLFGPKADELNSIYDKCEAIGWWDRDKDAMQKLSDEWQAIAYSVGLVDLYCAPQLHRK